MSKENIVTQLLLISLIGLWALTVPVGLIHLETEIKNNHNKRFDKAYEEGIAAGAAKIDRNLNPYDENTNANIEWKRGYNKGLIGEK